MTNKLFLRKLILLSLLAFCASTVQALEIKADSSAGLSLSPQPESRSLLGNEFDQELTELESLEFDDIGDLSTDSDNLLSDDSFSALNSPAGLFDENQDQQSTERPQSDRRQNKDAEDFFNFEEAEASEAMRAEWDELRKKVKGGKEKAEAAVGIDSVREMLSAAPSHAGTDQRTRHTFDHGYQSQQFDHYGSEQVPTLYKLMYKILNARNEYPLTFYSVVFFLAFFVIIKSVLLVALKFR